ncbi:MAG: zf-HC2 domain-containing protein [Gemmatimonadetes bacterium]|nr:zf-HC2 domain-containing protein [Gemmatimonadota bacterium]
MNTNHPITCEDFRAAASDLLDGARSGPMAAPLEAHMLGCNSCRALAQDLLEIREAAGSLPDLAPSRDLWAGIESRIQADVVALPMATSGIQHAEPAQALRGTAIAIADDLAAVRERRSVIARRWFMAAAASMLVTATAGITWQIGARQRAALTASADSSYAAAMAETRNMRTVAQLTMDETFDREIAALRALVDERRAELDSATVAVIERNLVVIDQAIAESKAALAQNPANAFLLDRLAEAYDSKLRTLRAVAALPVSG